MAPEGSGPSAPPDRFLRWLYFVGGSIGFVAAFVLLVEKIELLKDPSYVPSCSINPILSCGSIMKTDQAELFGFPNPILGVAGFAIVATVGAAMLGGAQLHRWFWAGMQVGVVAGAVLVHWLIFQSLYRIDALCPYCMVVWLVTIPICWYTTLRSLGSRTVGIGGPIAALARTALAYHGVILTAWYLLITGLIAQRFWEYWSTLWP